MKSLQRIYCTAIVILTILIISTPASADVNTLRVDISTPLQSAIGEISFNTTLPAFSLTAPLIKSTTNNGDVIEFWSPDLMTKQDNVTSESDAPQTATSILQENGGIPEGAILSYVKTVYLNEYNTETQQVTNRSPLLTQVIYRREINGMPVEGPGGKIDLSLGENGKNLGLLKIWRTATITGTQNIISASSAVEKLQNGELLDLPQDPVNLTVNDIKFGYYEKGAEVQQEYFEPIWIFYGNSSSGEPIDLYIYARHFANFTVSDTNISTFQTVKFTDISDTTPTQWYWDFGDGTNSTEQNPSHMYTSMGNFTVSLRAWNDMGSDTETKTDLITVSYQKPINSDFNATPTLGSFPMDVQFYDISDSSPDQWFWDFGDDTNSTEQNPVHTYQSGGNFTVNLTVWNVLGSDTVSRENYIYIYPTPAPMANFVSNFSWDNWEAPLAVAFNDTTSSNITTWLWDFGDGTNSTEQNPVHIFNIPEGMLSGYFPITLTVTDNYGRASSYWDYIYVYRAFDLNFTAEPQQGPVPLNVTFTETSMHLNNYYRYIWDFGDGNSSEWQWHYGDASDPPRTISHEYTSSGNYTVTLTIWANSDMSYTTSKDVTVGVPSPTPVADFVANTTSGKEPLAVGFTDLSSGNPTSWNWTFGDGTTAGKTNPVHIFTAAGNYTVSLEVANDGGSNTTTKIDYITVLLSNPPVADFRANTTAGKSPIAVAFTDNSTNSPVNWSWDFGDEMNSTEQDPVHVYSAPGKYTVSLHVVNNDGSDILTRTDYITVLMELPTMTIVPPSPVLPVSNFTATPLSGKEPLTVIFNDSSTGIPASWLWSFGDGGTSSESDPLYNYTSAGNYTVSLKTTNPYGTNATTRVDFITVLPLVPPVANFTATPLSGKTPLTVTFNDTSTGSPYGWTWDFGDGSNATDQNPTHMYLIAGNYSVSLTAQNADGTNSTTKIDYITVSPRAPPVAGFTANSTSGKSPLAITFTDTSTNFPTSWNWTFGDGALSQEQNPVHIYSATGTYTVSLSVANPDGSDTAVKTGFISTSAPALPVADFTANTTSGNAPLVVAFTDSSTGQPTTWYWDFGDGKNSSVQNPVHPYISTGTYSVTLAVTNPDGSNTRTRTNYITVTALTGPTANFTAQPTYGKTPLKVTFNDISTGNPAQWFWIFGDGTNSTVQNPVHTYTANGKYTVSLTATNAGGSNTKTRTEYIIVSCSANPPVAKFVAAPTCGTAPLNVKFNDTSTGSPTSWYWNFGDGMNATQQNPAHIYTSAGKFTVSLTVTNSLGSNTRTEKEYITVKSIKPPSADFSGKPTSGRAPLAVVFNDTSTGSPTAWSWNFGDNTNSTLQNPVHTFLAAGIYTVSMTASNTGGNGTKTRNQYISVSAPAPSYLVPRVNGTTEYCKVRLDWDVIADSRLQGYKVVISKSNPYPEFPDDGYMYWITDRYQNSSVIDTKTPYKGGDIGGYLKPGQKYYFSITAVYTVANVPGNAVELAYPDCANPHQQPP